MMLAPDAQAQWAAVYVPFGWVPAVPDAGWGWRLESPPPLRLDWLDYWCCFLIVFGACAIAALFRHSVASCSTTSTPS
jgi:hypothetical protein